VKNLDYILLEYKTAVKREMAIRYAKAQANKLKKPFISDLAVLQKKKDSFFKTGNNKLVFDEESRVDRCLH